MSLIEYLGKFHPLVVHLPIGILSLFLVLALLIPRIELQGSAKIIRLALLISALSATLSSMSGFILMNTGSYSGNLVTGHQVMGIVLTLVNWVVLIKLRFLLNAQLSIYRLSLSIVLVLMIMTGHAGGSLTHGSDFLVPPAPSNWFKSNLNSEWSIDLNTNAYDVAQLIMQEKCIVCHGPNKQKGGLRLDNQTALLEGGKTGNLLGDQGTSSLFIHRVSLPLDDDEHMPPRERKQLTETEMDFLTWWINQGTSFDQTLSALGFPDSLSGLLSTKEIPDPFIPSEEVDAADINAMLELKELGVVINPIAKNSPYLSASFVNVLEADLTDAIGGLLKIKVQLIYLYLDDWELDKGSWEIVGQLGQLRKLSLTRTNLNDNSIGQLNNLNQLVSLNLVGTDISKEGLLDLSGLNQLQYLYTYQTAVKSQDYTEISKSFPQVLIDSGNYLVPTLASDTTVLRLER